MAEPDYLKAAKRNSEHEGLPLVPLSREEKERILKAIEEDAEFRYALMGLLGFKEILDRITKLEEGQQALAERLAKVEERQQALEERVARLEERYQRLEERFQKLEERFAKLEERYQRLEERFAELEKRYQRLEERFLEVEKRLLGVENAIRDLQKTLATIAHRFGVLSESAFREAVKGIVEELFGASAYRWTAYDSEGIVYGHPAEVEVDVVVTDEKHLLVEIKSRADASDVLELTRIAKLYEAKEGVKPELAIVAGFVSPKARRLAEKLGVKIYTYIEEE